MDASRVCTSDESLERLAERLCLAGWRTPALALLSAASPLSFIARQLLLLTQPLWGASPLGRYAAILQQPTACDELALLLSEEPAR